jgi:16S rRNA (guanine527-N7)-methyltransferase
MTKLFEELLSNLNIKLTEEQTLKLDKYYELLVEWNEKINLTSIIEKEEVFIKHFYDSLCLLKGIKIDNQKLLDVGSGAGFPSLPLKIVFPNLDVTIIDALNKRIKFLEVLTTALDLKVRLIHGRAEEHMHKNNYDIVTARAVANLRLLSELCIPFVKPGGVFIALKGPKHIEEIESSYNAFKMLNAELEEVITYNILDQERSLVIVKKIKKSEKKYPRMFAQIKKSPL